MFRLVNFIILTILLAGVSPAMAEILFYENCEKEPSTSYWRPVRNGDAEKSFSVSSEHAKAGSKSWKYTIGAGQKNSHNEHRLNAPGLKNFPYNKEFWIGYSVFIPSGFKAPGGWPEWGLMAQFHGSPDSPDSAGSCDEYRNPILGTFSADSNLGYHISFRSQSAACSGRTYDRVVTGDLAPFSVNAWHDVVMHIKFNHSSSGITKIWVDGVLAVNDTGPNCFNDNLGPYMLIGPYAQQWAFTMYIDEIKIGDASSSYKEVSPSTTSPLPTTGESPSPIVNESPNLVPPSLSIVAEAK